MTNFLEAPEDVSRSEFLRCPSCYIDGPIPIDGSAFTEQIRTEINETYTEIQRLLGTLSYMTRLYTTLSPDEMNSDPIFSINPDLDDVSNIHQADVSVTCNAEGEEVLIRFNSLND